MNILCCDIFADMTASNWIQLGMLIISLCTFIGTMVLGSHQYKSAKKSMQDSLDMTQNQIKQQFFAEYTRRYQDIIVKLPMPFPEEVQICEIKEPLRLYFDLCSEEFYLHDKNLIYDEVWEFWTEGMRQIMGNNKSKCVWRMLKRNYNVKFCTFFENHVISPQNSIK